MPTQPYPSLNPLVLLSILLLSLIPLSAQGQQDRSLLYVPPQLQVSVVNGYLLLASYQMSRDDENYGYVLYLYDTEDVQQMLKNSRVPVNWSWKDLHPDILPMIFFDRGSSTFPSRYQQFFSRKETNGYRDNRLIDLSFRSDHEYVKYYEILNILGDRMSRYPEAVLQIEGSYTTEPGEKESVGYDRALKVQHYLQDIWGIDTSRILFLPVRQFGERDANGMVMQEERRVTFFSEDPRLLAPVSHQAVALEHYINGFEITIDPKAPASQVAAMNLIMTLGDDVVSNTVIPVSPDSTNYHLNALWALPHFPKSSADPLVFTLLLQTQDGTVRTSNSVKLQLETSRLNDTVEFEPDLFFEDEREEWVTFPFYGSGDSALQPWQRNQFDSLLRRVVEEFYDRFGRNEVMNIVIYADVERGEIPGIDPAEIDALSRSTNGSDFIPQNLLQEGTLSIPLYLLPERGAGEAYEEAQFEEELNASPLGELYYGLEQYSRQRYRTIDLMNDLVLSAAALQQSRSREILQVVQQGIVDRMLDTILVDVNQSAPESLQLYLLPEERFYSRSIRLVIRRGKFRKSVDDDVDDDADWFDEEYKSEE